MWVLLDNVLSLEVFFGIVVPVIAILFVIISGLFNIIIKIRKYFPVQVNCWFCNTNTKVPYDSSNSWVCPSCTQYNGFTEDGDYNREIPAQYQCRLNPQVNITDDDKINYSMPYNGLCFGCNRNQEMKIHQLASFVPEQEENYDEEVEEYQRQLEQSYKLCSRCERVLKRTLNDVKRNILGSKLAQINTDRLKIFDIHKQKNEKLTAVKQRQTVANVCLATAIVLLVIKLGQHVTSIDFSKQNLEALLPPTISQTILMIISYLIALKYTLLSQWNRVLEKPLVVESVNQLSCVKQMAFEQWTQKLNVSQKISDALNDAPDVIKQENALPNLALACLAGMLFTIKTHVSNFKLAVLMLCCILEIVLKTDFGTMYTASNPSTVTAEVILSTISLCIALSCIGQTAPRIQHADDLNSSFHKIYSQQESDCDYSDTYDGNSSTLRDTSNTSHKNVGQHQISGESVKSLETTKSISPGFLNGSHMRSFLDNSFSSSVSMPRSQFGSSVYSLNRHNTPHRQQQWLRNLNHSVMPRSSLTKTFSGSVDNFVANPNTTNALTVSPGLKNHTLSVSSLHNSTLLEDRFGEDIDRLSISGRMSVARKEHCTFTNNPFATHHINHDQDENILLRYRAANVSPPRLSGCAESGTSWIAGGYWGSSPQKIPDGNMLTLQTQHPFMSRTSSQSSGFESQPTRRPTPEALGEPDIDRISLFSEPISTLPAIVANQRLNQTFNIPPMRSVSPAAAPSHGSFHNRNTRHPMPGSRNLFDEPSLFQPVATPASSTFAQHTPLSLASTGSFSTGLQQHHGLFNARLGNVFPPQQSQTTGIFQTNLPNFAPNRTTSARRSLLNLSKLSEVEAPLPGSTNDKCLEE